MSRSHALGVALIAVSCSASLAAFSQGAGVVRLANPDAALAAPLPVQPNTLQTQLTPALAPTVSDWIQAEARALLARNLPADAMIQVARADVAARFAGQIYAPADIDTLVQLVMSEAAKDAQSDLQASLSSLQAGSARKTGQRSATAQMSAMSPQDQLKLQMLMDRQAAAELALSNMMKSAHDTRNAIINNLK
jgi:hypothetical protein